MSLDVEKLIARANAKNCEFVTDDTDFGVVQFEDALAYIEHIVDICGGNPNDVVIASGQYWDMKRLEIATNPKYTDRCRNHPYFQDLLGKSYGGKVFQ